MTDGQALSRIGGIRVHMSIGQSRFAEQEQLVHTPQRIDRLIILNDRRVVMIGSVGGANDRTSANNAPHGNELLAHGGYNKG